MKDAWLCLTSSETAGQFLVYRLHFVAFKCKSEPPITRVISWTHESQKPLRRTNGRVALEISQSIPSSPREIQLQLDQSENEFPKKMQEIINEARPTAVLVINVDPQNRV